MHVCRRLLEQRLTLNAELRTHFVTGLREQLGDAAVLHAALKPMAVTGVSPVACLAVPACLPASQPAVSPRGTAEGRAMAEQHAVSATFMKNKGCTKLPVVRSPTPLRMRAPCLPACPQNGPITGDSFARVLLNVTSLQVVGLGAGGLGNNRSSTALCCGLGASWAASHTGGAAPTMLARCM